MRGRIARLSPNIELAGVLEDPELCPVCGHPSLLAHGEVLMMLRKDRKPWGPTWGNPTVARTFVGARVMCNRSGCRWEGRLTETGLEPYDWDAEDHPPQKQRAVVLHELFDVAELQMLYAGAHWCDIQGYAGGLTDNLAELKSDIGMALDDAVMRTAPEPIPVKGPPMDEQITPEEIAEARAAATKQAKVGMETMLESALGSQEGIDVMLKFYDAIDGVAKLFRAATDDENLVVSTIVGTVASRLATDTSHVAKLERTLRTWRDALHDMVDAGDADKPEFSLMVRASKDLSKQIDQLKELT